MHRTRSTARVRDRARGQVIVIFAVAVVAMLAMVGLILDGGATFAQRRDMQNVSDVAALAGANDYLLNKDTASATIKARAVAARNGYTHGTDGVTVAPTFVFGPNGSVTVRVDVSKPHRNSFAGIVGMPTWQVSTTAAALSGVANTALGAAPMIFSIDAFDLNGNPLPQYANADVPYGFGDTNNDAPDTPGDFAWTNYGTGNVNSNEVRQIIGGELIINKTLDFGEYIGQHNNGNHTTLYDDNNSCEHKPTINKCLSDTDVPVPVVDHEGHFLGWAMFHVDHADKQAKKVYGHFLSGFTDARLTVGECNPAPCTGTPGQLAKFVLKLVD